MRRSPSAYAIAGLVLLATAVTVWWFAFRDDTEGGPKPVAADARVCSGISTHGDLARLLPKLKRDYVDNGGRLRYPAAGLYRCDYGDTHGATLEIFVEGPQLPGWNALQNSFEQSRVPIGAGIDGYMMADRAWLAVPPCHTRDGQFLATLGITLSEYKAPDTPPTPKLMAQTLVKIVNTMRDNVGCTGSRVPMPS
ncbi:hypothetical protein [Yinghuangia seranimata]|uniref:hypothetical protein n=1 Tax=Yinghuangia seranimata TaxID=408067 RepID=UPI00248B485D|nr:hypothetical protein [Yinghuangia seranimata]MDI2129996.1 hypothetical protein [Yinghuangia seranimata]